jgi:hypothetical protein
MDTLNTQKNNINYNIGLLSKQAKQIEKIIPLVSSKAIEQREIKLAQSNITINLQIRKVKTNSTLTESS